MAGVFAKAGEFVVQLLSGGTFEIVLLIVLIVVGLILFLVALFLLVKLLILLGKGLLWVFRVGGETAKEKSAERREAQLSAAPAVATSWDSSRKIGLRSALAQARRLAGPDALSVVVLAGEGGADLCRGLGLTPPGVGVIGIAADADMILIDVSQAETHALRRLAAVLPWRRPTDGVAVLVASEGVPPETLARSSAFARLTGMRVALHFVLPSSGTIAARSIVEPQNRDGTTLCTQLAGDVVRVWLDGGSRSGLKELALAQSRELPTSLDRALAAAPGSIDVASLCFGGAGLRAAVAQTLERTRPSTAPGIATWVATAVLVMGAALTLLSGISSYEKTQELRSTVDTAYREATVPWTARGIDTIPSAARMRRLAGLSARLAEFSSFSPLTPLAPLAPNFSAPENLGAAFLVAYVLRPLASALDREARKSLEPSDDPSQWLSSARRVDEWIAAWEGLEDDPREVDMRRLFVDAFGGDRSSWAEGTDLALVQTGVKPPAAGQGGLDPEALSTLAGTNFVLTMQRWADSVYTNGPVASAARRAIDRSTNWREQHAALLDLRTALQDPSQQWLTDAKDRPDLVFEVQILGRALALSILGETDAISGKAAVAKIRKEAREAPQFMIRPEIGPLMTRSGSGSGPSLLLSPSAEAWFSFLDDVESAGFADLPQEAPRDDLEGPVTLDIGAVAETNRKLEDFNEFASNVPAELPPGIGQNLVREIASELVIGVAASVELALRAPNQSGTARVQVERLVRVRPALEHLAAIEQWLRARGAQRRADRVLTVRGRIAENVLAASAEVLYEENPLRVIPNHTEDPTLGLRLERGIATLLRIYKQSAESFVDAAESGGDRAREEWAAIRRDLEGFERGDEASALTRLERLVEAYVVAPKKVCNELPSSRPGTRRAGNRDYYIAKALSDFHRELDKVCNVQRTADLRVPYEEVREFFYQNLTLLWPFAKVSEAEEVSDSTMNNFVQRLDSAYKELAALDDPFAVKLKEFAEFWTYNSESKEATVRFKIQWRPERLREEEKLAHNVESYEILGADDEGDGIYSWRYGAQIEILMQLAKDSPYRFVEPKDSEGFVHRVTAKGSGSLLRVFAGLAEGALVIKVPVVHVESGMPAMLWVPAEVSHPEGTFSDGTSKLPKGTLMTMPDFSGYSQEALRPG